MSDPAPPVPADPQAPGADPQGAGAPGTGTGGNAYATPYFQHGSGGYIPFPSEYPAQNQGLQPTQYSNQDNWSSNSGAWTPFAAALPLQTGGLYAAPAPAPPWQPALDPQTFAGTPQAPQWQGLRRQKGFAV